MEAKPIPSKHSKHVLRYLEQEYIPRFSIPEIVICDNGLEFKNNILEPYLMSLGIDVHHSTPHHPQTNVKIERFHKPLKEKLVNARSANWEKCLGPALWAHRVSQSVVTGFTPYFLTYGMHPVVPKKMLFSHKEGSGPQWIGEHLDELSLAFKDAARNTEDSRFYNTRRLQQKANAGLIEIGDHVCVLAHDRNTMDPKWDHRYVVMRLRGPVVMVLGPRKQPSDSEPQCNSVGGPTNGLGGTKPSNFCSAIEENQGTVVGC